MSSFPRSILAFQRTFATEEQCWKYLTSVRWPDGVFCPVCGEPAPYLIKTRAIFQCPNKHQFSPTAGTIMHRSHMPLQKWFWAAWLMTTQTPGISAMVLARQIEVHYETAYMVLQRLRAATVPPLRGMLSGKVEVDETYISAGRPRRTRKIVGRGVQKPVVVAGVETSGVGRIRLRRVNTVGKRDLCGFVQDHVQKGSVVITDGWPSYKALGKKGFRHRVVKGETKEDIARQLPRAHQAFSELQAWLVGTHHGVSAKHLQAYLNEYAFRRDARADPQAAFLRILQIGTHRGGPGYEGIYSAGAWGGWKHPNPRQKRRKQRA